MNSCFSSVCGLYVLSLLNSLLIPFGSCCTSRFDNCNDHLPFPKSQMLWVSKPMSLWRRGWQRTQASWFLKAWQYVQGQAAGEVNCKVSMSIIVTCAWPCWALLTLCFASFIYFYFFILVPISEHRGISISVKFRSFKDIANLCWFCWAILCHSVHKISLTAEEMTSRWKSTQHTQWNQWGKTTRVSVQQGVTGSIKETHTVATRQEVSTQPQEQADCNQEGKSRTRGRGQKAEEITGIQARLATGNQSGK